MITARTSSIGETQSLAAALAELLRPCDVVLLIGDLGAGKTAFVQGLGRALGITEPITSPTFVLAREYQGRLGLHHLDVYRIEDLDEVVDLALPELLDSGDVTCIEWGDALVPALPADYLEVRLTFGEGDDDRVPELRWVGPSWGARRRALATIVEPWTTGGAEQC